MRGLILILTIMLGASLTIVGCTCKEDKTPSPPVEPTEDITPEPTATPPEPTVTPVGTPEPPDQPTSGPGGADYKHASVDMSVYGQGDSQYWIFEPASPTPSSAPLVVFNHGWIAMTPKSYGAWIHHIVRKGNIVVYPRYQSGVLTPAKRMTGNAIDAVKDAIDRLESADHITPELENFALVGHSLGGGISMNMATYANSMGLPQPKAIMLAEPGHGNALGANILADDFSPIPSDTLIVIVVGNDDKEVGDTTARNIMGLIHQIDSDNKQLLTMYSDYHGEPSLVADHYAPVSPDDRYGTDTGELGEWLREMAENITGGEVDTLDYYGFWKLFDGLIDTAFYGKNREYAFDNTPEQQFMGKWSDGTSVVGLSVD